MTYHRLTGATLKYFRHSRDIYSLDKSTKDVKKLLKVKREFYTNKVHRSIISYYKTTNMATLVRQIFASFWELAINHVLAGKGAVTLAESHFPSVLCVENMEHNFTTPLPYETFIDANRVPILSVKLNRQAFHDKRHYRVHLDDNTAAPLFENYNSGVRYCNIPISYTRLLPALEEKYYYIEPSSIKKIVQQLQNNLTKLWRNKQNIMLKIGVQTKVTFYLPCAVPLFMQAPLVYRRFEKKKEIWKRKFGTKYEENSSK